MTTSARKLASPPRASSVSVTEDTLVVELEDGRTLSAPLAWYPRLTHATSAERARWRLLGRGDGWQRVGALPNGQLLQARHTMGEGAHVLRYARKL